MSGEFRSEAMARRSGVMAMEEWREEALMRPAEGVRVADRCGQGIAIRNALAGRLTHRHVLYPLRRRIARRVARCGSGGGAGLVVGQAIAFWRVDAGGVDGTPEPARSSRALPVARPCRPTQVPIALRSMCLR